MAQPANVPRWNTDGSNRTDPPTGQKDSGFVLSSPLVSSYLNWLFNTIYLWTIYLRDLTSEGLTWLVTQTFNNGIVVTKSGTTASDQAINATAPGGAGTAAIEGYASSGVGSMGGFFSAVANAFGYGVRSIGSLAGVYAEGPYGLIGEGTTLAGVKGNATSGAGGYFTSNTGFGVDAYGGTNKSAVKASGSGTGAGVEAVGAGGSTEVLSASHGVATFAGSGGNAVFAKSGSVGSHAVRAEGSATAFAVQALGTTQHALDAFSTAAPPARLSRGDSTALPVMDARGSFNFDNASDPLSNVALKNIFLRKFFPKVMAFITCNSTIAPVVDDSQNVTGVTQTMGAASQITITFAQPFLNTNYRVESKCENTGIFLPEVITKNVGFCVLQIKDPANSAQSDATLFGARFSFYIFGNQ